MIDFSQDHVRIGQRAATKEEAIHLAAEVLVKAGCIDPAYEKSMIARELEAKTYLGQGIAIPHGLQKDRALIKKTSIAVIQLPEGVQWGERKKARIVIAIAAKSDEHLEMLTKLTYLLDDQKVLDGLYSTQDPEDLVRALSSQPQAGSEQADPSQGMTHRCFVTIHDQEGLHARPATKLIDLASPYKATIYIRYNDKTASVRSLPALLKLGAKKDSTLELCAEGADADEAIQALAAAIEKGLDQQPSAVPASTPVIAWKPSSALPSLSGVPASPGLGIAPIFRKRDADFSIIKEGRGAVLENKRLNEAIEAAKRQLEAQYDSAKRKTGEAEAAIFLTHRAYLEDEEILSAVHRGIERGESADYAWKEAGEEGAKALASSGDSIAAGRAADLRDVFSRVQRILGGVESKGLQLPDHPVILAGEDFSPSETADLDPRKVAGLISAQGGPTSHSAITARALGIPAIVGAGSQLIESLNDGLMTILDGSSGRLYLDPGKADLESASAVRKSLEEARSGDFDRRFEPAYTLDGHRVEVVGNAGKVADAAQIIASGGEGIGLLRSEFLFLDRATAPSEEEQFEAYRSMAQSLSGLPLVIRTLDIGGDKRAPYIPQDKIDGSFLGIRGIRTSLIERDLFETQLRAIYRAGAFGDIRIMFPMVSSIPELQEAKAIAESVRIILQARPLDIGIMVEVPSAALLAEAFAREAAFFSIGTNDLTQYTLAMDRLHPQLAKRADSLDPAVLRMVSMTVKASEQGGIWTGVCGGAASEALGALILAGLGVHELSVSVSAIASVKACIRRHGYSELRALAAKALACESAKEVRALGKEYGL